MDLVGRLFGTWRPAADAAVAERPAERGYLHVPYDSAQTHVGVAYAAVPYRHDDYFRAWARSARWAGG